MDSILLFTNTVMPGKATTRNTRFVYRYFKLYQILNVKVKIDIEGLGFFQTILEEPTDKLLNLPGGSCGYHLLCAKEKSCKFLLPMNNLILTRLRDKKTWKKRMLRSVKLAVLSLNRDVNLVDLIAIVVRCLNNTKLRT